MFKVQHKNFEIQLEFLVNNHPDYKNIIIDKKCLFQLPCNEIIIDTFSIILHNNIKVDKDDKDVKDEATTNKAMIDDAMIDKAMI